MSESARVVSTVGTAICGGLFVREHHLKAGQYHQGHKHYIDHVTFVASGTVLVTIGDNKPTQFLGPCFIPIDKDMWHTFEALSDRVIYYCVFSIPEDFKEQPARGVRLFGHKPESAMSEKFCGNCTGCAIPAPFGDVTDDNTKTPPISK